MHNAMCVPYEQVTLHITLKMKNPLPQAKTVLRDFSEIFVACHSLPYVKKRLDFFFKHFFELYNIPFVLIILQSSRVE